MNSGIKFGQMPHLKVAFSAAFESERGALFGELLIFD